MQNKYHENVYARLLDNVETLAFRVIVIETNVLSEGSVI